MYSSRKSSAPRIRHQAWKESLESPSTQPPSGFSLVSLLREPLAFASHAATYEDASAAGGTEGAANGETPAAAAPPLHAASAWGRGVIEPSGCFVKNFPSTHSPAAN